MDKGTCSVEGCERTVFSRSWCSAHYNRWLRLGGPGSAAIQVRAPGRTCSVDGCGKKYARNGYCRTHAYRASTNGDPLVTRPSWRPPGPGHPNYRGDDVAYPAIHRRLREYRGPASLQACVRCNDAAEDWAYVHDSPTELVDPNLELAYSTDLSDYVPMCKTCHYDFDRRESPMIDAWPAGRRASNPC